MGGWVPSICGFRTVFLSAVRVQITLESFCLGWGPEGKNREGGWCVQVLTSSCQRQQGLGSEPVAQSSVMEVWAGLWTGEGPGCSAVQGSCRAPLGSRTLQQETRKSLLPERAPLRPVAWHTKGYALEYSSRKGCRCRDCGVAALDPSTLHGPHTCWRVSCGLFRSWPVTN